MDRGRCLLRARQICLSGFGLNVLMLRIICMHNRSLNVKMNSTPYELFFGNKPNVDNLRLYGSKIFVRVPEELREHKWDRKADLGKLVGYTVELDIVY